MEKWRGTYLITFLLLDVSRGGADQLKNNKIKQESDIWKNVLCMERKIRGGSAGNILLDK